MLLIKLFVTMLAVREQQDDVALSKTQRSIPANARPATPDQDEARSLLVERMQSQYEAHSLRPLRRPVSLRESATKKLGLSFKHIRLYGGLVDISTGDTHASLPFSSTTMQDDLAILHHVRCRSAALQHSSTPPTAGNATHVCQHRAILPPALQFGWLPLGMRHSHKRRCMAHSPCRSGGSAACPHHARLLCGETQRQHEYIIIHHTIIHR